MDTLKEVNMWTKFWDMNSGGGTKEQWSLIFIEAPEEEAIAVFYNRFGHDPNRVTCACCGSDYSISEEESLTEITGYHRNAISASPKDGRKKGHGYFDRVEDIPDGWEQSSYKRYRTEVTSLEDFINDDDVKVIFAEGISDDERDAYIPESGWVYLG